MEAYCYRKKKAQSREGQSRRGGRSSQGPSAPAGSARSSLGASATGGSGSGSPQRSSADSETQEIIRLLSRLVTSTSPGAAGSVTQPSAPIDSATASQSSALGSPSTSTPGICPWILDSGASFHMTPDCTCLSSIRSPPGSPTVHTADGSSLPVVGHGTLLSDSFHVPNVSYVPDLTMQLMSASQLTDHDCRVILDPDFCYVQDCRTGQLVGTGPRRRDSQHLWALDWLRLPSVAPVSLVGSALAASSTSSFDQWHHRLGHLCGSRLSSLIRRGLLGSVSGYESLAQCTGCWLGKQI